MHQLLNPRLQPLNFKRANHILISLPGKIGPSSSHLPLPTLPSSPRTLPLSIQHVHISLLLCTIQTSTYRHLPERVHVGFVHILAHHLLHEIEALHPLGQTSFGIVLGDSSHAQEENVEFSFPPGLSNFFLRHSRSSRKRQDIIRETPTNPLSFVLRPPPLGLENFQFQTLEMDHFQFLLTFDE